MVNYAAIQDVKREIEKHLETMTRDELLSTAHLIKLLEELESLGYHAIYTTAWSVADELATRDVAPVSEEALAYLAMND